MTMSGALTSGQAKDYFEQEYSVGDYYKDDGEKGKGEWIGTGCKSLGLTGEVSEEKFNKLLEGKHPESGELKIGDGSKEHRAGYDCTFSAPKSVSIMALVGGDKRIIEAHKEAVNVAMREIEKYVQTRDQKGSVEFSSNFVVAQFHHDTSRTLDPQLHTHNVVLNWTKRDDGQWRAVEPRELFRSQQYATAIYRSELAKSLREMGYELKTGRRGAFEIDGVSQDAIKGFSKRREEIKAELAKRGVSGAEAAERVTRATRDTKQKGIDPKELIERWKTESKSFNLDVESVKRSSIEKPLDMRIRVESADHVHRSVEKSIQHLSERSTVFDDRQIAIASLNSKVGQATLDQVKHGMQSMNGVVETKYSSKVLKSFTTQEAIDTENRMINIINSAKGTEQPILAEWRATKNLSEDQQRVATMVLGTRDRIVGVQGLAGTGKTYTMEEIRVQAESAGFDVKGFAPTTGASKLLAEAGIESRTIASLIERSPDEHGDKKLWIVDEAGMVDNRQMAELLERAEAEKARVILVGDVKQHAAVNAGDPFRLLQEKGMQTESLTQIRRQKDPELREIVSIAANGRSDIAMSKLIERGNVEEIENKQQRHEAIAKDFMKAPERTLVTVPSNQERRELNAQIRGELKASGIVKEDGYKTEIYINQNLTKAEKSLASSYEEGDRLTYRGSKEKGIEPGASAEVIGTDREKNQISVRFENGKEMTYDPSKSHEPRGEVWKVESREFAEGDRIQFKAPLRDRDIPNGTLATIGKVDANGQAQIKLEDGRNVHIDFKKDRAVEHAYAVTSHSSQGKTIDRVIVGVDVNQSKELINSRQAYVSISRAREEIRVYTNSKEDLAKAVGEWKGKYSAVESVAQNRTVDKTEAVSVSISGNHGKSGEITEQKAPRTTPTQEMTALRIEVKKLEGDMQKALEKHGFKEGREEIRNDYQRRIGTIEDRMYELRHGPRSDLGKQTQFGSLEPKLHSIHRNLQALDAKHPELGVKSPFSGGKSAAADMLKGQAMGKVKEFVRELRSVPVEKAARETEVLQKIKMAINQLNVKTQVIRLAKKAFTVT